MAKLSEILAEYGRILIEIDAADGEIEVDIAAQLNACEDALDVKIESIERLCESLGATADAVRKRAQAAMERARAMEAKAARIHSWALEQLEAAGLDKFAAGQYTLARRVNPPRLEIVEHEKLSRWLAENHPEMIRVVEEIDKKAVLTLAKSEPVPGAMIARGHHWRVS